jgi:GWxTD domain-containing protein
MIKVTLIGQIRFTLGILLFYCIPQVTFAQQTLETVNQALRYSRYARISLKIIPLQQSERSFLLQMPVEKIEEGIEFDTYLFSYVVLPDYNTQINESDFIPLNKEDIKIETDIHFYFEKQIEVPEGQEMAIALLRAVDTRQDDAYYYHIDLISPFVFNHPDFGAFYGDNIPFDQAFAAKGEAFEFRSRKAINLYRFFYPTLFEPPLPPMELRPAPVQRDLKVEYKGDFLVNTPRTFEEEGYYFIQSDTNSTSGKLIKTVHEAFPKVKTFEEMVEMVMYISTRKEHEILRAAEDKKKALDQYWFSLTKDENKARQLIRDYFKQVEFANILFTDFKEGWKTDRGMVYTVMGPPNEVFFRLNGEIWTYLPADSNSKITFTFARVKNILTPNYFVLNRSRALQPEWFKSITTWRNGEMDF